MEDWIEKLNNFLNFVKWNSDLALLIQDYLNHTEFTSKTVDNFLMGVTKLIETSLREAVAKFTSATVPPEKSYGPNLLNYAKNKGFIPESKRGNDSIFSLIYWYFEKPRNTTHHFFTNFPLPTIVMFVSTANFILNEIERLSKESNFYGAKTVFDYNATSKTLFISVADITKDNEAIVPPKLEMNLISPEKAIQIYPLNNNGALWDLRVNTEGLMKGTYSVYLAGCTKEEKFKISGSTIVVI